MGSFEIEDIFMSASIFYVAALIFRVKKVLMMLREYSSDMEDALSEPFKWLAWAIETSIGLNQRTLNTRMMDIGSLCNTNKDDKILHKNFRGINVDNQR